MPSIHRKVTKIGNSLGITFSKKSLSKIGAGLGDELEITVDEGAGEIVIRKLQQVPLGLNPRFFEVLQANLARYRQTVEELRDG